MAATVGSIASTSLIEQMVGIFKTKLDKLMGSVQETFASTPGATACEDHKPFMEAMERYP